jgi:hypothetical protein
MGPIGCPETSVRNYHYSLRNNHKDGSDRLFRNIGKQSTRLTWVISQKGVSQSLKSEIRML